MTHLDPDELIAALGGMRGFLQSYDITSRNTMSEIRAMIESACEAEDITIGRPIDGDGAFTFSADVRDLTERVAHAVAPRARPVECVLGALEQWAAFLRMGAA